MVTIRKIQPDAIVAIAALWFVVFWIGFDNMGAWGSKVNNLLENCSINSKEDTMKKKRLQSIKKKIKRMEDYTDETDKN